ncbi:STAS domain-containing protein [Streptomyces sp. NRRL B-24484]|uniref:STAS domain-containing protein n=1 Tax=Streptomyces sp. NRRL B-24484 TaxID=1463833 RepID=UPI0006944384|nr:STAS domain-containing protein [Streptomyces sp. NRRL B-24484]
MSAGHGLRAENTIPTGQPLRITITRTGGSAQLLHLTGEVDQDQRRALEHALACAVADRPARLVVGMAAPAFCDSTTVNALLAIRGTAKAAGVELVVAAQPAQARWLCTRERTALRHQFGRR